MGMTHQRGPDYQAMKVLDLSGVAESDWRQATRVRLSAFFCVRDYSWHDAKATNGLDEFIEIVVNSKVHRIATKAGLPAAVEARPLPQWFAWHDFDLPKEELVRGRNEIVFRLAPPPGKAPDDYLYLGIDNSVPGGNSAVRFSGSGPWDIKTVNSIGAQGEYMVRLYLIGGERRFESVWRPAEGGSTDPAGVIQYAGADGETARWEWDPERLDQLAPLDLAVEIGEAKEFRFSWLDAEGKAHVDQSHRDWKFASRRDATTCRLTLRPPTEFVPAGVEFDKRLPLRAVTLRGSLGYRPVPHRVDMAPRIQPPKGTAKQREASCRIEGDAIELGTGRLRARFSTAGERLRLISLDHEIAAADLVRQPDAAALFLVEADGACLSHQVAQPPSAVRDFATQPGAAVPQAKRYAGSRDFRLRSVVPLPEKKGFAATLVCAALEKASRCPTGRRTTITSSRGAAVSSPTPRPSFAAAMATTRRSTR